MGFKIISYTTTFNIINNPKKLFNILINLIIIKKYIKNYHSYTEPCKVAINAVDGWIEGIIISLNWTGKLCTITLLICFWVDKQWTLSIASSPTDHTVRMSSLNFTLVAASLWIVVVNNFDILILFQFQYLSVLGISPNWEK